MKITVQTGIDAPIVLHCDAVLAATCGESGVNTLVYGRPRDLADMATSIMLDVRGRLGDAVFEAIVRTARRAPTEDEGTDHTAAVFPNVISLPGVVDRLPGIGKGEG